MIEVTVITGLEKKLVPLMRGDEITYQTLDGLQPVSYSGGEFLEMQPIKERVIPVHMICRVDFGKPNYTHIAYTEEVEQLLGIPFNALKRENNQLTKQNFGLIVENERLTKKMYKMTQGSLWEKLKLLFGGAHE